ncbi:MAG: YfhO family protein [Eubacteriales bacterium]|nr:YfhO family protein [Eubacteriales bacterium]
MDTDTHTLEKAPYVGQPREQKFRPNDLAKAAKRKSLQRSLASFFLAGIILWLAFGIQGVTPFGDKHILTVDLYHQYAPFLGELRTKLLSGESLFFTWSGGLGLNFLALFAYYLASPLNLIAVLFPASALSELVLCLVLLKVSLASLTFRLFLKEYYHRDGPLSVGFALAYALSGYTMAYFFNIMWLDTLYLLPLLAWAMVRLVRYQLYATYVFVLGLTLIVNFYTGFFVCLFLFFFFFIVMEREELPPGQTPVKIFLGLAAATIIGLTLSAIVLMPTYKAMQLTSAVGDNFPDKFEMLEPTLDFLSRLLPLSSISIRKGMANIFCGSFVLFLLFAFFKSRLNPSRRKWLNFALLLFLCLSLNNNVLNFVWHGFHYPNQLPFRNSFVLVFYLLFLAYDGLSQLKGVRKEELTSFGLILALLLLVLRKVDTDRYPPLTVGVALVLLTAYGLTLATYCAKNGRQPYRLSRSQRRKQEIMAYVILAIMLNELVLNSFVSIYRVASAEYFGSKENYASGEEVDHIREVVNKFQQEGQPDLIRMEILPDKSVNDAVLYQTQGFTIFTSTFPQYSVKTMSQLGFANNGINSFQYCGSTPVMDSLLGIRYVIHREKSSIRDTTQKLMYEQDGVSVEENELAMPVAFLADPAKLSESPIYDGPDSMDMASRPAEQSPFAAQTQLFSALTGQKAPELFTDYYLQEIPEKRHNLTVTPQADSTFSLQRNEQTEANVSFSYQVEEAGNYYLAWRVTGGTRLNEAKFLTPQGSYQRLGRKARSVVPLGQQKEGNKLEIMFDFKGDEGINKSGTLAVYLVSLNEDAFEEGIAELRQDKSQVVRHDSRSLDLQTSSERERMLFFSTGFDPGWTCAIDGEPTEIRIIDQAFMGVKVPAGEHQIKLEYTPEGFDLGWKLSLGALIVGLLLAYQDWRLTKSRKKKARGKE